MDYRGKLAKLAQELRENPAVELLRFDLQGPMPDSVALGQGRAISEAARQFYAAVGAMRLEWRSRVHDDPDVAGRVNILPLAKLLGDWRGDIYFEEDAAEGSRRFFHPFDFFVPEAAAGILIGEEPDPQVYLYTYDEEPLPLGVDLAGYVALLLEARGFLYWQMVLAALVSGCVSAEVTRFRSAMPQLFPAFDAQRFEQRFRKLRLKRK